MLCAMVQDPVGEASATMCAGKVWLWSEEASCNSMRFTGAMLVGGAGAVQRPEGRRG
jgi:hypothetical protein